MPLIRACLSIAILIAVVFVRPIQVESEPDVIYATGEVTYIRQEPTIQGPIIARVYRGLKEIAARRIEEREKTFGFKRLRIYFIPEQSGIRIITVEAVNQEEGQ